MKRSKKTAKPVGPSALRETSRTPLGAEFGPGFLDFLRTLSKGERREIGEAISRACDSFGDPHSHRGLGVRDLGDGFYECRLGLGRRLVFGHTSGLLHFLMIGDH